MRDQVRRQGVKVAVNTVRRVMEDAGDRRPKVERDAHDRRYEAVRPNQFWHLDFVHRHVNRTDAFTLIHIDDFSRFVVGHGVDDAERAARVVDVFSAAVERHGRSEAVMK
jgi:transposase InsO family protein